MPPQPLSRVKRTFTLSPWRADALEKRPELSAIIGETISLSALMEYEWAAALIQLLRADPRTGMAMYSQIASAEAQRAVLLAAAKAALLVKKEYLVFEAVMNATAHARRIRNQFAHHIWTYDDALPEDLILIDPRELTSWEVGVAVTNKLMAETGKALMPPETPVGSAVMVWKKQDLLEARKILRDALEVVSTIRRGLDLSSPGLELDRSTRRQLLSHPEVLSAAQRVYRQNGVRAPNAPSNKKRSAKP